ncbi:MAG TPA: hypothetical protein VIG29_19030, partial [Vicinamibacteria bacterium]
MAENELAKEFLDARMLAIVDYLRKQQSDDGEFRTLRSFCGEVGNYVTPTEHEGWYSFGKCSFVAASVVFHLDQIRLPGVAEIKRRGCEFLSRSLENGVARYQPAYSKTVDIPPDVDDTSMVTSALRQNGWTPATNVAMVMDNTNREGDFYMWIVPRWRHLRHPRNWIWLVRDHLHCQKMMRKWATPELYDYTFREYRRSTDPGVAANVLVALGESARTRKHIDRLIEVVEGESPPALDYYGILPLYFHVARLYHSGVKRVGVLQRKILSNFEKLQSADGCVEQPLFTATAALTFIYFERWDSEALNRALRFLAVHPMHESGWKPFHYYHDPAGVFEDGGAEMTATLFLEALYRYRV